MDETAVIKELTDDLLSRLLIKAQTEVVKTEDIVSVNIKTEEGGILIGYHGETLSALQLVLGLLVSRKVGQYVRLIVNVGDYREKREEKLREIALDAARRAKETNQEVVLWNLSPWQRRVIHMTLAEDKDVTTESQGEEPDRQLVIRPE